MLRIYGTSLCKDCTSCIYDLSCAGIEFKFMDFSDDISNLKEFLKIRDSSPLFENIRNSGRIGIPCLVKDDGTIFLEWESFLM